MKHLKIFEKFNNEDIKSSIEDILMTEMDYDLVKEVIIGRCISPYGREDDYKYSPMYKGNILSVLVKFNQKVFIYEPFDDETNHFNWERLPNHNNWLEANDAIRRIIRSLSDKGQIVVNTNQLSWNNGNVRIDRPNDMYSSEIKSHINYPVMWVRFDVKDPTDRRYIW